MAIPPEKVLLGDQSINKICQLEYEITQLIQKSGPCYVHFQYLKGGKLQVITYNFQHGQAFLMGEFDSDPKENSRVPALEQCLKYLRNQHPEEFIFTVKWKDVGKGSNHVSYFRGKNEEEVKKKFFLTVTHLQTVAIESIVQSPMS